MLGTIEPEFSRCAITKAHRAFARAGCAIAKARCAKARALAAIAKARCATARALAAIAKALCAFARAQTENGQNSSGNGEFGRHEVESGMQIGGLFFQINSF